MHAAGLGSTGQPRRWPAGGSGRPCPAWCSVQTDREMSRRAVVNSTWSSRRPSSSRSRLCIQVCAFASCVPVRPVVARRRSAGLTPRPNTHPLTHFYSSDGPCEHDTPRVRPAGIESPHLTAARPTGRSTSYDHRSSVRPVRGALPGRVAGGRRASARAICRR